MTTIESNVEKDLNYIFSPESIRKSSAKMYTHAMEGNTNFVIDMSLLEQTAKGVIDLILAKHPTLEIPYHSRWRHFEFKDVNLLDELNTMLANSTSNERVKAGVDLIVVSVLLDAGAGSKWRYTDPETAIQVGRSEGLGLASLKMFIEGAFSSSTEDLLMVDADTLLEISFEKLAKYFQVSDDNPLVGLNGRLGLLNTLGKVMIRNHKIFPNRRPGDLVSYLTDIHGNSLKAKDVLAGVIAGFGDIWPGRTELHGKNLGDVWQYPPFGKGFGSLVSFHKLSQWLTYSIIETLQMNTFSVTDLDDLTGLAEYRNGGLFIDSGVLILKDKSRSTELHKPDSELIIEWRSLTIYLLDLIADLIRNELGMTSDEIPLVKILEGGTWLAGRRLAQDLRDDASPPILLDSDGTVF